MKTDNPAYTRRNLLVGSVRAAAAAGIALLSGGLLAKRALRGDDCQAAACGGCAKLQACSLPAAMEARQGERRPS
jgi:hypothetical protein